MDSPIDLPRAEDLPRWMSAVRDRFLRTDTGQFIIHGNVHDWVLCMGQTWDMSEFLDTFFAPSNKLIVHYDPGRGIWFSNQEHALRAARALVAANFIAEGKVVPRGWQDTPNRIIVRNLMDQIGNERNPEIALELIEVLLLSRNTPTAAVIHYAELVAPDGPASSLNFLDRTAAARLHRWSLSQDVVGADNIVLMLTSSFSDLARRLTRNPRIGAFQIPLPDRELRTRLVAALLSELGAEKVRDYGRFTAGLQLRQIKDVLMPRQPDPDSNAEAFIIDDSEIAARKKDILEQECFGLIEVIDADHGFDKVGGMDRIKGILTKIAAHVREGRATQTPMGVLFVGPMGTGKSFLAEAFARESGLAAIKLKNFRDKWVGSTEANLEKVLTVVEALGEILVMIDEGDRSIGGAGDSDGGVSSRVIARLKEFMSDPSHRGRIIFVMMTNRPDKLDTDMKRPGRFDLKIPFFPPNDVVERAAILHAVFRRHDIDAKIPDDELHEILEDLKGYAAADLEALALLAYNDFKSGELPLGLENMPEQLTGHFLRRAVQDFMPTRETDMIEYMELLAVHEASNRRLLPERYADIEVDELNERLAAARQRLINARVQI